MNQLRLASVCLCTYKRETLLKTLESLVSQEIPTGFSLEVVVVDNDVEQSGRKFCEKVQASQNTVQIRYFVNGVRNISEVRNSTMEYAQGELLLFLDDDEWAADELWFTHHLQAMHDYQADVVSGTVITHYPESTPDWLAQANLLGHVRFARGKDLQKAETCNAMLKASWVKEKGFRFDPYFGKSGGEDTDFFHRIYLAGAKVIFEPNAVVEELIEPSRANLDYVKKMNTRFAHTHYEYLWSKQSGFAFIKTGVFVVAQIAGYSLLTLLSLPFGKARYMRFYVLALRNWVKLKTALAGGVDPLELYGQN